MGRQFFQEPQNFNRVELSGSNPVGSFTLPDKNLSLGSYGPIYETSVVKLLLLCFHSVIFIFVAPALARCDIGVWLSIHPSFCAQFMSTLACKSI